MRRPWWFPLLMVYLPIILSEWATDARDAVRPRRKKT